MDTSKTYVFKKTSKYKIQLEFCSGWVFLHCDVYTWSKEAKKELCAVVDELVAWLLWMRVDNVGVYTKNTKFMEVVMPYMVHLGKVKDFEVYSWE